MMDPGFSRSHLSVPITVCRPARMGDGGGRMPVSRMLRHEPQSRALRAAAGQGTVIVFGSCDDFTPSAQVENSAPSATAAGTRRSAARAGGRKHFSATSSSDNSVHDHSALITNVGRALDHGEDYKQALLADRFQPPPKQALQHPIEATPGTQRLMPPFAIDSTHHATANPRAQQPLAYSGKPTSPLEGLRHQREAGVASRDLGARSAGWTGQR